MQTTPYYVITNLKKFLTGKTKNDKVNNWAIELSCYKLNIQYIKDTENVLADCLSRPVDIKFTTHDYEPKGQ